MRACLAIGVLLCALGCAITEHGSVVDETPIGGFLDSSVRPTSQAIHLDIDPDREDYSGSVEITVDVSETTDAFRFHAERMTLDSVTLEGGDGPVEVSTET